MIPVLRTLAIVVANLFKSRPRLEAENVWLRHQLNVALRRSPAHLRLSGIDRALLVWLARLWPDLLNTIQVVKPETVLRWHPGGLPSLLVLEVAEEGRAPED